METHGPITRCQACEGKELQSVLFLGYLPPVNTMRAIGSPLNEENSFPAELLYCPKCHLVQLGFAVRPDILFPPDYPYTSGTTRILRENFSQLCREARALPQIEPRDLVLDIGSNDGTLLSNFVQAGHPVVGIEPSLTGKLAEPKGIPTIMAFFDRTSADRVRTQYGAPKIVAATNVFAHIPNVHDVLDNLEKLLHPKGVFISESHYLGDLVSTIQYDVIYHEHLRYYSLTSLNGLLSVHGFRIFDVRRIPTHGGSIRVYASKSADYPTQPSVAQLLREEAASGLVGHGDWIPTFRRRVVRSKLELYELLQRLKKDETIIYGIGAPSRATTLIHYVGLDDGILDRVLEVSNSKKLDHYIPGTKIPVVNESLLLSEPSPYVLLLSWHIAQELRRNLRGRGYRGDFIVPLPSPRLLSSSEEPPLKA